MFAFWLPFIMEFQSAVYKFKTKPNVFKIAHFLLHNRDPYRYTESAVALKFTHKYPREANTATARYRLMEQESPVLRPSGVRNKQTMEPSKVSPKVCS